MIQVVGISHHTASHRIRGQYFFYNKDIVDFVSLLQLDGKIKEIVILSTCNRTELYFTQYGLSVDEAFQYIYSNLSVFKNIQGNHASMFYNLTDKQAVQHLFEVSSGMDSMLLGEDQIIGQIKDAYLFCTDMGYTDAILMRLFQKSFEAGKRVRTETSIKSGITSVSHLAVQIIEQECLSFDKVKILVLGAGKAASLAVSALKKKNLKELIIANRSQQHAQDLLNDFSGRTIDLNDIHNELPSCDAVLSAINSKKILITQETLRNLSTEAGNSRKVFIDISTPANIEKPSSYCENIIVYQIDDLKEIARKNAENRSNCLTDSKIIVQEVVKEYLKWYAHRSLRPAIQSIKENLSRVSEQELAGYVKDSPEEIQEILQTFGNNLTQKYIRMFIRNLKTLDANKHKNDYIALVDHLFSYKS